MVPLLVEGDEKVGRAAPRSDSEFTFQSYDCSSRASTLPHATNNSVRLIDLEGPDEVTPTSNFKCWEIGRF